MATGIQDWSLTAGSNGNSDSNINFAEGQTPASLNNSNRAMMAALAAFYDAIGGGATYGGSSNAYTVTNSSPGAWTAYAEGQIIGLEANHSNNGAATVNVDGLGAKSIVKSASTAVVSGDIISGAFYLLRYDGTNFQIVGGAAATFQPLDATLTALAALSWSSGNALVQFTAADTVSLTLAPSVTSVTTSGALTIGGVASFAQGSDALPGIAASAQASTGIQLLSGGIRFGTAGARRVSITAASMSPASNDLLPLGTAGVGWSDLFLAEGAVIDWDNGDATLTQTGNVLELTGAGLSAALNQVSGVGGVTLAAATHRNRQLLLNGNITLDDGIFAAGDWGVFTADGSDRTITRAAGLTMYVNGTDSASATVPARTTAGVLWESATVCHLIGSAY